MVRGLSTIELIFLVVLIVPPILLGVLVAIDRWRRSRLAGAGAGQPSAGTAAGEDESP